MLDGKWEFHPTPPWDKSHDTLLKAKRHCSKESSCFGVGSCTKSGSVYSILYRAYSINLTQQEGSWYIHKKEKVSGNFVYNDCQFAS